jgi:hypothetical protein
MCQEKSRQVNSSWGGCRDQKLRPKSWDPKVETQKLRPKSWDPKVETQKLRPKSIDWDWDSRYVTIGINVGLEQYWLENLHTSIY